MSKPYKAEETSINPFDPDKLSLSNFPKTAPDNIACCYFQQGWPFYYLSPCFLEMLGYTYPSFLRATQGYLLSAVYPADRAELETKAEHAFMRRESCQAEYRMLSRRGEILRLKSTFWQAERADGRRVIVSLCSDAAALHRG